MPDSPKRSTSKTPKKPIPAPKPDTPKTLPHKARSAAAKANSPFAMLVKKIEREHGVVVARPTAESDSGWVPLGHERMLELAREVGIITRSGKLSSRYK